MKGYLIVIYVVMVLMSLRISEGLPQYDMLSETARLKWANKSNEPIHDTVCFIGKSRYRSCMWGIN